MKKKLVKIYSEMLHEDEKLPPLDSATLATILPEVRILPCIYYSTIAHHVRSQNHH